MKNTKLWNMVPYDDLSIHYDYLMDCKYVVLDEGRRNFIKYGIMGCVVLSYAEFCILDSIYETGKMYTTQVPIVRKLRQKYIELKGLDTTTILHSISTNNNFGKEYRKHPNTNIHIIDYPSKI